jgi:hypothetical protein
MAIDVTVFELVNVADTCAVWNVLSSPTLYRAAKAVGCQFCCTVFVDYECLFKRRTQPTESDAELCRRLRQTREKGDLPVYPVDVEDLIDNEVLSKRQHIGKGELSSMVFARKIRQALLTDDQRTRRLAVGPLDTGKIQTTPHLAGWLFFERQLVDGDLSAVTGEHQTLGRPLGNFIQAAYEQAMRARLGQSQTKTFQSSENA